MKVLTVILTLIFSVFGLHAQNPDIIVTGSTTVSSLDPCLETHSTLTVRNTSNNTLHILCEKNEINFTSSPGGISSYFCWGANCYGMGTLISSSFNELLPGEADNIDFGGYYDADCTPNIGIVEYCFYDTADVLNRSCITITYNGSATSVNDDLEQTKISEFFPNPAINYVQLDYILNTNEKATLHIVDVLGNTVKKLELKNSASQRIYVGDLANGLYFGNLLLNEEVITAKKLIIKR
ncbi:MAG: T9SS type A sorting domain-containing protein [Bacteroidota bacterium]|nr:T9SS type A sorting domain-containing protein [Bacteroidota bacterium]